METIAEALAEVVDRLNDAGLNATPDNRNLNPPAVYVAAPTVLWDRLGAYTLSIDLFPVVPNMGRIQALETLGPMLETIRTVWPNDAAYPIDLITPELADPLPGFRVPITVHTRT